MCLMKTTTKQSREILVLLLLEELKMLLYFWARHSPAAHQVAQLQAQHKLPSWQIFGLLERQVHGCGRLMSSLILHEATGAWKGSKL